ncbi:MAG: CoA transferase, partial [Parvibaculum sp.]
MKAVLDGVRVLDFGRYIAGPYCAALLGDMGAEVIRIERREGSEDRFVQPIVPDAGAGEGGEGAMFLQMNRNKKGLTLDPMTETGRSIVRRLVATADVVVANLPPATLKAMGLDYESLTASKPDIILTTVSAFGHGGPYSERTGFDGVAQSMVGAAYLTGHPDEPMKSYAPWVDFGTASLSAFGTLAALMERAQSGKGQVVEGSLLSTALAYFNFHLIEQQLRQTNRIAIGNRSPYAGPADIVQTKDGWILVQVIGMPLFKRWAKLMGEDHWLTDPRFKDDLARGDNGKILSERTARWAAKRTSAEALAELEKARIPAGPVYSPQQALDDPHIQAMNYLKPVEFPGLPGA